METFFTSLAGMFLFLAIFYLLGVLPVFAHRFYPGQPRMIIRCAAPLIFAGLAMACFQGAGLAAMLVAVTVGTLLIAITAHNNHKNKIGV